jgi:uncharacterized membrane protein YidH (DUF202 family)
MHDTILLRAAVLALIPVGFSIGICFFVFAYLYLQSIRGKDVSRSIRRVRLLILVLFAVFVGIFAVIRWAPGR